MESEAGVEEVDLGVGQIVAEASIRLIEAVLLPMQATRRRKRRRRGGGGGGGGGGGEEGAN